MPKAKPKKRPALPDNNQVMINQLVTPEARAKGDYQVTLVADPDREAGEKGAGASAIRNNACDTIKRWETDGSLDKRQVTAVDIYRRAHVIVFGSSAVTVNWARFLSCAGGSATYLAAHNTAEAKDDLSRIDKILKSWPPYVADTWSNIVIHDLGAGPAGEYLNHKDAKAARASALTIIRLCCDMIATEFRL